MGTELGYELPSCSRLMRDESEDCLFGTLGDAECRALPSVTIPCDYSESSTKYATPEWVQAMEIGVERKDIGSSDVSNPVVPLSDVSHMHCPNGFVVEKKHIVGISTCARDMLGPSSLPVLALPATILARPDRSCDQQLFVFNNSSPLRSILVSIYFGFFPECPSLGQFASNTGQIYRIVLFKNLICRTCT